MADFIFTSPGAKFKERDLTFVTRNVGVTTLGLVGETMKGPAFEPIFIQDKTQFRNRFGGQSIRRFENGNLQYQLPYVANAYLEETNQLWVTRVLGLSGFDAGNAWAVTINGGVDPETITVGSTTSGTELVENGEYRGAVITAIGQTGVTFTGFEQVTNTTFEGISYFFEVTDFNILTGDGEVNFTATTLTADVNEDFHNMVVAVVRSRGLSMTPPNGSPTTTFNTDSLIISGNTTNANEGNLFGEFQLVASNLATDPVNGTVETYTVSLNPNSSNFLPSVIGREPQDKDTKIWVEAVYPDLIRKIDVDGPAVDTGLTEQFGIPSNLPYAFGVSDTLLEGTDSSFTDYRRQFATPETPWVVSQLRGSAVDRLFKFYSVSDGNSANREIKISIQNINPITLEFDVIIRDWADTDDNLNILESFSRCSMIEGQNNFIGQRIGTVDGEYDLKSRYVILELADDINPTSFPAGFEGYQFKDWSDEGGLTPRIFYKTNYLPNERPRRVFLGVSTTAYSTDNLVGRGINQNFFNFNGQSGFVNTHGFHMDAAATGTYNGFQFETGAGAFQTVNDVLDANNPYFDMATRKFTLVPAGGFDGWDVHRTSRTNTDGFQLYGIFDGVDAAAGQQPLNDLQAWETAINTFANPEEVTINLFATPGLNWSDNSILVRDTIEMIETERTDSLYILDSPDLPIQQVVGEQKVDVVASQDIVELLDASEIDSNYACTYFPWIQIRDTQNNANVFIPPTGEVVKAMAFTDNSSFPWFAPAGLNRGVTDARRSKYKLSLEARDILYAGRINPMADFADSGTAIFGQKTLQVRESALDRINVRRLLLQIKVLISNIAVRLLFEQNDQATIDQFLQKATPLLDTIRRERGLQEFRIKMDDSNNTPETLDRNELYGEIFLKPTRALEFIGITFTITPSGAAFEDFGA